MKTEIKPNKLYSSLDKSIKKSLKVNKELKNNILDYLINQRFKELSVLVNKSLEDEKFLKILREAFRKYTKIPYTERGKDVPKSFKVEYTKRTIIRKNTMLAQKFGMGKLKNSLKFGTAEFKPDEQGKKYIARGGSNPDLQILFNFGDFRRQVSSTAFSKALGKELKTGNYTTVNFEKSKKQDNPDKLYISCNIGIKNIIQLLNSEGLSFWANPSKTKGSRNNQMKATLILKQRHKARKFDMFEWVIRRAIASNYKGSSL